MPRPSHPPWLDNSNYTWRTIHVMKLLIMQFSPASYHFIALRSKYSLQTIMRRLKLLVFKDTFIKMLQVIKVIQEVLWRTNRLLSLIRHGPRWKRRVQQFFYRCMCIRYRGNVYAEPLPSNGRVIFIEPMPSNDRGIHRQTRTQSNVISKAYSIFSK
jgi:hypothetical protein